MANNQRLVVSHLTLRRLVGILGVGLPVALPLVCLMFGDPHWLKGSISAYYDSIMRNVFVGVLSATGVFLFAYKGYDSTDDCMGNVASFGAIGVAFLPSSSPHFIVYFLHYVSALAMFGALSYFALVLFRKMAPKVPLNTATARSKARSKARRNTWYMWCGLVMVACIVSLLIIAVVKFTVSEKMFRAGNPVFWLETALLVAFGVSWFIKGRALRRFGL